MFILFKESVKRYGTKTNVALESSNTKKLKFYKMHTLVKFNMNYEYTNAKQKTRNSTTFKGNGFGLLRLFVNCHGLFTKNYIMYNRL
jgi:hypothetical protein